MSLPLTFPVKVHYDKAQTLLMTKADKLPRQILQAFRLFNNDPTEALDVDDVDDLADFASEPPLALEPILVETESSSSTEPPVRRMVLGPAGPDS